MWDVELSHAMHNPRDCLQGRVCDGFVAVLCCPCDQSIPAPLGRLASCGTCLCTLGTHRAMAARGSPILPQVLVKYGSYQHRAVQNLPGPLRLRLSRGLLARIGLRAEKN